MMSCVAQNKKCFYVPYRKLFSYKLFDVVNCYKRFPVLILCIYELLTNIVHGRPPVINNINVLSPCTEFAWSLCRIYIFNIRSQSNSGLRSSHLRGLHRRCL